MTGEKGKDHSDTAKENFVVNSLLFLSMVPDYNYTEEMTAKHDFGADTCKYRLRSEKSDKN